MIVSVLPNSLTVLDNKSFTIEAINVQWKTDWSLVQDPITDTPIAALEFIGANALAASVAVLAATSACLF